VLSMLTDTARSNLDMLEQRRWKWCPKALCLTFYPKMLR
jgi:hypothetical protein